MPISFSTLKILFAISTFIFFGCATNIERAELAPDADPAVELDVLERDIATADTDHLAVLAPRDFRQAQRYLKEAKSDLGDEQSRKEILGDIGYARAYLERAKATAAERRPQIQPILAARAAAIKAGAHNSETLKDRFHTLDNKLKDSSENFPKNLSSDEVSILQNQYLAVELAAIQEKYLGLARSLVKDAKKNESAERRAPNSFKKAETDLKTAENIIAVNRYDLPGFSKEVIAANTSAQTLREVLNKMNSNKKINESVAFQMVRKDLQISKLKGTLGAAETELESMNSAFSKQGGELKGARAAVSLQAALVDAQESFNEEEADVFQKGNALVVRLKKIGFPSGSSMLPATSFPLLAKVEGVIGSLNAQDVMVEGHTDSTGGNSANQKLSEARAQMVADYLKSNGSGQYKVTFMGHGESKPIASNETKEGRAQNRRVDVVIQAGPQPEKVEPKLSEI